MKQTGGSWDPNRRQLFFTAGSGETDKAEIGKGNRYMPLSANLFAVNDLAGINGKISRNGSGWRNVMKSIDAGCPTFLDSGVFAITNIHKRTHGTTMDEALALAPEEIDHFDWLYDTYVEVCTELGDQLWGYNELDQGGRENKIRIRHQLEGLGLKPIPVYHPLNDGWGYFDDLAQEYDRMCYGNLVQAGNHIRKRLLATAYERHTAYPDLFIHFLGLTPNELQMSLPFDSADSSAWTAPFRWNRRTVKFGAAGRKRWPIADAWLPPLDQPIPNSYGYGDMTIFELWMGAQNMAEYQRQKVEAFGLDNAYSKEAS